MQTIEFNGELHTIPGYRVKGLLGQGGMATVYLAEQLNLCRDVALKVMAPQFAATPGFAERFLAEGRMTARLNHPNIVTVHVRAARGRGLKPSTGTAAQASESDGHAGPNCRWL